MLVVLAGNPNAGKTTLFNALTHSGLRTGNFHGVTTSAYRKTSGKITYSDSPGTYAFSAYSLEEAEAVKEIKSADIIVNVIDASTLENSLPLTRALIAENKKVLIYITKMRQLKRRGGFLNAAELSSWLGVPVFDCPPSRLKKAIESGVDFSVPKKSVNFSEIYRAGKTAPSKADKLFYNRYFALAFFVLFVILTFFLAFHPAMPGEYLKGLCERFIGKVCAAVTANMGNAAVTSLLEEGVFGGAVALLSFLPQLFILYSALTLLDESGIMSALAFCTDGLFEKFNLSGRAAFSLVTGFGCTTTAIATTRGFVSDSARRRTIAILPFVPCSAKLPVFLTFLSPVFKNPFPVLTALYFAGVAVALLASVILKGGGEAMLSEVAPITLPQLKSSAIKLFFYLKGFIMKVGGVVLVFCIVSWFFSHYSFSLDFVPADKSMLAAFSRLILPLFRLMGADDWRVAFAALCGAVAKENVAATINMLAPDGLNLPLSAAVSVSVFILFCPACVAAFAASVREAGLKFTLKCVAVQLILAFLAAYTVNLIL